MSDFRIVNALDALNTDPCVSDGELLYLYQTRERFHPSLAQSGRWKLWFRPSGLWVFRRNAGATFQDMSTKMLTDKVWMTEDGNVWHDSQGRAWHRL